MTELDILERVYQGDPGEEATITVTAKGTQHMVTFSLNENPAEKLKEGDVLRFPIPADLLMVFGFSNPSGTGGSYTVVLEKVEEFADGKSQRVFRQVGATPRTKTYTFLT